MLPKDNHCWCFDGFPSSHFTVYAYALPRTGKKCTKLESYCIQDCVFSFYILQHNIVSIFLQINSVLRVGSKSLISRLRDGQEIEAESQWPRRSNSKAASEALGGLHWFPGFPSSTCFHQSLLFVVAAGFFSDKNNTLSFLWGPDSTLCSSPTEKFPHHIRTIRLLRPSSPLDGVPLRQSLPCPICLISPHACGTLLSKEQILKEL